MKKSKKIFAVNFLTEQKPINFVVDIDPKGVVKINTGKNKILPGLKDMTLESSGTETEVTSGTNSISYISDKSPKPKGLIKPKLKPKIASDQDHEYDTDWDAITDQDIQFGKKGDFQLTKYENKITVKPPFSKDNGKIVL